ncbi:MAG TPA: carbamoyltransferase HypF [Pseudobacteroides sp.]|uniref:carbamoyltransferase HypF n=1 Tax=Pseudobacteroides sp. TaxID=1968840 RepID=UPI002F934776
MTGENVCIQIRITGIVQGVGFRPFVLKLAKALSINGFVNNVDSSVIIVGEGNKFHIDEFCKRLKTDTPKNSWIKEFIVKEHDIFGYKGFIIIESSTQGERNTYISPDVSVCSDCREEFFNSSGKRYLYPFINCTNCGPRFTIIEGTPYDRDKTTMKKFTMCPSCFREYNDIDDRRYHAQPISCPQCGPTVKLYDSTGKSVNGVDVFSFCSNKISQGKILAVKGIGGYHLACDALNDEAVSRLRKRKIRDEKPFAVMVKDYETALRYCHISPFEKELLQSKEAPIVLLKLRENVILPRTIAPGNPFLGVMLPYTPIHLGLINAIDSEMLVMTSGNKSSEPICYMDKEAISNLKDIADYFLIHDRDIYIRTDDSVTREVLGREYIVRRSRGYVPLPIYIDLEGKSLPRILACGGELKNTFCITKGDVFYISHHIGDLENLETNKSFEEGIEHFKRILDTDFDIAVCDLHPEYLSTKYAAGLHKKLHFVQHHHAHIASCMGENNLSDDVIGVAFDGTGYGEDGNIWGGEFFIGGYRGFKRAAHLEYIKMPGGDMAVKEPWRMAISYILSSRKINYDSNECDKGININGHVFLKDVDYRALRTIEFMMERDINCPLTSSMGRLFDAVSAILGIRYKISYEGQAAIELEQMALGSAWDNVEPYGFSMDFKNNEYIISTKELINDIISSVIDGEQLERISLRFHETIAQVVLQCCGKLREESCLDKVALSGGVFQNITLLTRCIKLLSDNGFQVFFHEKVPSNDGGISLGQALMAAMADIE